MDTLAMDSLRPLMFSIAYRMLGSVAEAEDIVQEAYLRIHASQGEGVEVESPKPYAVTVTTRLAIDHLKSARVRRERYVGTWLPEPLVTARSGEAAGGDPAYRIEIDDSVSMALLVVMESLSPVERAVFLLRDVFEYGFDEIASIIGKSEANCRQIAVRARQHVRARAPRFEASPEQRAELTRQFWAAAQDGDLAGLEEMLADGAVFYGDGGGKGPSVRAPIVGAERVARFLLGLFRLADKHDLRLEQAEVNGRPGVLALDRDGRIVNVVSVEVGDGRVQALHSVVNPDKLHHLGPVGDLLAILHGPGD